MKMEKLPPGGFFAHKKAGRLFAWPPGLCFASCRMLRICLYDVEGRLHPIMEETVALACGQQRNGRG